MAAVAAVSGAGAGGASGPPVATVLDCGDHIRGAVIIRNGKSTPYRFRVRRETDTVVGPVAFAGARTYGRQWRAMVQQDQWLKSIALVQPGARVTIVVPAAQRGWMRLEYLHGNHGPVHAVTIQACERKLSPYSGGFTIDYARAPHQGRCATVEVWIDGRDEPLRRRVFRPGRRCP